MPPTDSLFPESRRTPALKLLILVGVLAAAWLGGVEVGDLLWIAGAMLIPFGGLALWDVYDVRRRRALRDQWRAQAGELGTWAVQNGWNVGRVMDRDLADDVEQMVATVDLPGQLAPSEAAAPESWEASPILTKPIETGTLLVAAGLRGLETRLWARLSTDASCAPMRLEVRTRKRKMFLRGTKPQLAPGPSLYDILDSADPIAHLQLTPAHLLLSRPGRPTPEEIADVADRLVALDRRLPR
jgi:hypothetical protein